MELFERIKAFLSALDMSERKMASALGLDQSQFNRYLTTKSQKNLWEYLPKILELHPRLNRYWLYFEEGEMFGEAPPSQEETSVLRQRIIDLEGQVDALKGQAEALKRESEALNKVVALQAQPLIGDPPFGKGTGVATSRPVAPSLQGINNE